LAFSLASGARASTTVINGRRVIDADWPLLLQAGFADQQGRTFNCTATLIGPQVVLTAAHCVEDNTSAGAYRLAYLVIKGIQDPMACNVSEPYRKAGPTADDSPRSSADYALCRLDGNLAGDPDFANRQYESVDMATRVAANSSVLVTGFGCTAIAIKAGAAVPVSLDGLLRAGDAVIASAATLAGPQGDYMTSRSKTADQPALCPGDSGGPLLSKATLTNQSGPRAVIGVNSELKLMNGSTTDLESTFAALATPEFHQFETDWIDAQKQLHHGEALILCGITRRAGQWPYRPTSPA
jgi:V8-like Glu-specific endopeptidase